MAASRCASLKTICVRSPRKTKRRQSVRSLFCERCSCAVLFFLRSCTRHGANRAAASLPESADRSESPRYEVYGSVHCSYIRLPSCVTVVIGAVALTCGSLEILLCLHIGGMRTRVCVYAVIYSRRSGINPARHERETFRGTVNWNFDFSCI